MADDGLGATTVHAAVPGEIRAHIGFPPVSPDHVSNSLAHLGEVVTP